MTCHIATFARKLYSKHFLALPLFICFLQEKVFTSSNVSKLHQHSVWIRLSCRHKISWWTEAEVAAASAGCNLAHLDSVRLLYIQAKMFITITAPQSIPFFRTHTGNSKQDSCGLTGLLVKTVFKTDCQNKWTFRHIYVCVCFLTSRANAHFSSLTAKASSIAIIYVSQLLCVYHFTCFVFFPLGSFYSHQHLPPAGSQCDIWKSDVPASAEEACDYAQLIWNH